LGLCKRKRNGDRMKISVREILEDAQAETNNPTIKKQLDKVIDLFCSEIGIFENLTIELDN